MFSRNRLNGAHRAYRFDCTWWFVCFIQSTNLYGHTSIVHIQCYSWHVSHTGTCIVHIHVMSVLHVFCQIQISMLIWIIVKCNFLLNSIELFLFLTVHIKLYWNNFWGMSFPLYVHCSCFNGQNRMHYSQNNYQLSEMQKGACQPGPCVISYHNYGQVHKYRRNDCLNIVCAKIRPNVHVRSVFH